MYLKQISNYFALGILSFQIQICLWCFDHIYLFAMHRRARLKGKFCPSPSIHVQSSKQANNQPYQHTPWREGEAEKSCAALSVSISTSTCHLGVCHLKALLLNEIKSMFNEIKDKKKYEVKSNCKKVALHLRMPENYVYLMNG